MKPSARNAHVHPVMRRIVNAATPKVREADIAAREADEEARQQYNDEQHQRDLDVWAQRSRG
jgi:hypothetical protein